MIPAWALLAYVVEQISGTPFDQYCTQNIFVPLGFETTLRGPQQEQPMVGHSGATLGGNSTAMYFRPQQGIGMIVLANGYGGAVMNPSGFQDVPGKYFPVYSFIPERLLNETAAQP